MTNHPSRARARFVVDGNEVTLTAENEIGEIVTTTYFVGWSDHGGFVRIRDAAGRYPQVCDKLWNTGPTLWATAATLGDVIKHEYRAARAERRRHI